MKKLRGFSVILVCLSLIAMGLASCEGPEKPASCDHIWDWVETKPPTATEAGEETYTCLLCGQTGIKRAKSSAQTVINSVNISIDAPVNGVTPNTTASTTDTAYTLSAVTWLPADSKFLGGTEYTASLTLTANSGYTFSGLNSATVNGQSADVSNNTGSTVKLSYVFPATDTKTITSMVIKTQPAKLTYTHGDQLDLTGLAVTLTHDDTTTEDVSAADFTSKNITASPAHGDNLIYIAHNGQPVTITYGELTQSTSNLIVNPKPITNVEISVTAPVKSATPGATANGTGDFTIGTVTWSPSGSLFLGGTVYTVSFTLTADSGYTFTGLSSATINGQNAVVSNNTGGTVTMSHTFPETDTRAVTNIVIKTQPNKLTYTHGDQLDLTGLAVTLTHDDTTTEDVSASDFASKNISANPSNGNHLVRSTHDGQPVTITYGELTLSTNNLTVNKAQGNFGTPVAINITYTSGLTLGSITLPTGYAWNAPTTTLNAGNGQSFAATFTDPSGNYNSANGNITVNVAKATGSFGTPVAINITYTSGLTLGSITLPTGYAWNAPTTTLNAGNNQSFAATFTDPSGNYNSANGSITVNVAKANGATVVAPTEASKTYNSVTLNTVTASTGQPVEYARNNTNTAPTTGWQESTAFSGFTNGATSYFFARAKENANYNTGTASGGTAITVPATTAGITISVRQIEDETFTFGSITISRAGSDNIPVTFPVTVENASSYTSISWEVAGVGVYAGQTVTGSGASFTLNAAEVKYNSLGGHALILTVTKGTGTNALQYSKVIPFTVVR